MRLLRTLTFGAMLIAIAAPALGQQSTGGGPDARIAEDVHGIRQAIDRVAGLLEAVKYQQRVDVLLRRIEMRERRLEPLERSLRSAQGDVDAHVDELRMLEGMREHEEKRLDEAIREGQESLQSETRAMIEDIERNRVAVEERMEGARFRVQQHENDLAGGRRDIEILDEMLLELLEEEQP